MNIQSSGCEGFERARSVAEVDKGGQTRKRERTTSASVPNPILCATADSSALGCRLRSEPHAYQSTPPFSPVQPYRDRRCAGSYTQTT